MATSSVALTERYADRHPSTVQILRWLEPNPNLPAEGLAIARAVEATAGTIVEDCADGPELTTGLRKLLEAKDAFVRAALTGR